MPTTQAKKQTWALEIEGMRCASCVAHVEEALRGVPGVIGASVNLATREARVVGDPDRVETRQLLSAVAASGYRAAGPQTAGPAVQAPAGDREKSDWLRRSVVGGVLLGVIFLAHWLVADHRLADRVVTWFVPAVLLIAAAAFAGWFLLGQVPTGARAAVAVMVVACPCALGLAAPMAVLVAGELGAQRGIFLRNAAALETARRLDTVLLDKTGTVTEGRVQLTRILPADGRSEDELLAVAAAVEAQSSHPLAAAVVEAAQTRRFALPPAEGLRVESGAGLSAKVRGEDVLIGNERLLTKRQVALPGEWSARIDELRRDAKTPILVAIDGRFAGLLVVADTLAPEAADAIAALHRMGLDVQIVSGDSRIAVESVARAVGIAADKTVAEVLPADKQQVVRELQQKGRRVAMVGDGINDAPALAAADLGLAIGAGADVAIEAADVVLAHRNLASVPQALALARVTLRTILQNLGWAFVFNALLIPAAALARVPPAAAAAAMASSSLLVVMNSLALVWRFRRAIR